MTQVKNLVDLIDLAARNPVFARQLREDPGAVAKLFGVKLSAAERRAISSNLNVNRLVRGATEAESYAVKVASGLGLRAARSRPSRAPK
jgi:hypothetical protein